MEIFARFFDYVTDDTKKIIYKAATVTTFIVVLFLLDNTLGFSYYYNLNNKLALEQKITSLLKDTTFDKTEKSSLLRTRISILNHKSFKDYVWDNITSPNLAYSDSRINLSIFFLSSTYLLLILMAIVLVIGIKSFFKSIRLVNQTVIKNDPFEILIKLIGLEFILYVLVLIEFKLLSYIPIIFNNVLFNYLINLLFNVGVFIAIGLSIPKKVKTKGK
jgi:hypothetical protein